MHYPGQQYTGPGTHFIDKIYGGVEPKNKTDFVTLLHDYQYMYNKGEDEADALAIKNSDYSMPGLATKLGLGMRGIINSKFNSDVQHQYLPELWDTINNKYSHLFDDYGIRREPYDDFVIKYNPEKVTY